MMKYMFTHNKTKWLLMLCMAVGLSIFFSSCNDEMGNFPDETTDLPGDGYLLEVPVAIVNQKSLLSTTNFRAGNDETEPGDFDESSYGADPLNENKIDKLDLLIFMGGGAKGHYSIKNKTLLHDTTAKTAKVRIEKNTADALDGKEVQIYLIANAKADLSGVTTQAALEVLTQEDVLSPAPDSNGKVATQNNFLMDGMLTTTLSWGAEKSQKVNETINLRRAASKIRLRIGDIAIKDYQNGMETNYQLVGSPYVRLAHYTEKGNLIQSNTPYTVQADEWKRFSDYREMSERTFSGKADDNYPPYNGKYYAAMPFYAYENDWSNPTNQANETYLVVKLKLRPLDGDGNPYYVDENGNIIPDATEGREDPGKDYFYRLPITYRMEIGEITREHINKLMRNHLYDISTSIEVLGSIDEGEPVEVESNIALQDWNIADEIDGTISGVHFLAVEELEPTMPNTSKREVNYISSTPVITKITRSYFMYFDIRGNMYTVEYDKDGNYKAFNKNGDIYYTVEYSGEGKNTAIKRDATGNELYTIVYNKEGAFNSDGTDFTATKGGQPYDKRKIESLPDRYHGAWDGATVTPSEEFLKNGILTIEHPVPQNYVPFYIEFDVVQDREDPLKEKVKVTQFPPRFVTGHESPGLRNGSEKDENGKPIYADFRHHTNYGALGSFSAIGSNVFEAQANKIFSRVSTVVPQDGEIIGVAVDGNGKTKSDQVSNKMISPEFIISSQFGISDVTEQRSNNAGIPPTGFNIANGFGKGFGPNSGNAIFENRDPYYNVSNNQYYFKGSENTGYPKNNDYPSGYYSVNKDNAPNVFQINKQQTWRTYTSAEDRCYNYFEGDYGADGEYIEHYIDKQGYWRTRKILKTFKYKGRWRIPTVAEAKMISKLQSDHRSTVKGLMYGSRYWTAQEGILFDFVNKNEINSTGITLKSTQYRGKFNVPIVYVRCVFDTFKFDDKGEGELIKR